MTPSREDPDPAPPEELDVEEPAQTEVLPDSAKLKRNERPIVRGDRFSPTATRDNSTSRALGVIPDDDLRQAQLEYDEEMKPTTEMEKLPSPPPRRRPVAILLAIMAFTALCVGLVIGVMTPFVRTMFAAEPSESQTPDADGVTAEGAPVDEAPPHVLPGDAGAAQSKANAASGGADADADAPARAEEPSSEPIKTRPKRPPRSQATKRTGQGSDPFSYGKVHR